MESTQQTNKIKSTQQNNQINQRSKQATETAQPSNNTAQQNETIAREFLKSILIDRGHHSRQPVCCNHSAQLVYLLKLRLNCSAHFV